MCAGVGPQLLSQLFQTLESKAGQWASSHMWRGGWSLIWAQIQAVFILALLFFQERGVCGHLVQFSSVQSLSCVWLCDPMDCSTPGLPVHPQLLELTQTHIHHVSDAIKPSHPLLSPSPPAFNLFQHQGLFQWVSSLHQVAKVLECQLQHQSFQWIFRTYFL